MYELPEKLKKLVPYQPLSGNYSIRLDANESFLEPPDRLREQIAQVVSRVNFNRYPDPYCVALCKQFADFFGVDSDLVVAGNGSDELIGMIINAFLSHGETMLVTKPDFSMYAFYAQMNAVKVETFTKDSDSLSIDPSALLTCAKETGAKLLILSNPCNPTSVAASKADILKVVRGFDGLVVIDEAYMDFSEGSILQLAGEFDNLIVLKTCSKAFGMAAIRLGFTVANLTLTGVLKAAKSPYNVNSMTQEVGCLLFSQREYLQNCIEQIKTSRDSLFALISALADRCGFPVYNTHTNFVYLKPNDCGRIFAEMEQRGIAIRHMGEFLRISAGSAYENQTVVAALTEILCQEGAL